MLDGFFFPHGVPSWTRTLLQQPLCLNSNVCPPLFFLLTIRKLTSLFHPPILSVDLILQLNSQQSTHSGQGICLSCWTSPILLHRTSIYILLHRFLEGETASGNLVPFPAPGLLAKVLLEVMKSSDCNPLFQRRRWSHFLSYVRLLLRAIRFFFIVRIHS
jgi:hypothetical protein